MVAHAEQVFDDFRRDDFAGGDYRDARRIRRNGFATYPSHRLSDRHGNLWRELGQTGNSGHCWDTRWWWHGECSLPCALRADRGERVVQAVEIVDPAAGRDEQEQVAERSHLRVNALLVQQPLEIEP